jgi:hypothetical protein
MGGEERLHGCQAGRLVGRCPLLFFDVAAYDEGVVPLGECGQAVALCHAENIAHFMQWQREIAAVRRLSNPDSVA